MTVAISGPVGRRWRTQNVLNAPPDQEAIIDLLMAISLTQGGQREAWRERPARGIDGYCPQILADAIWEFQAFWKRQGVFRNIDGVIDPDGNTLKQLNKLVAANPTPVRPAPGPKPAPAPAPLPRQTVPLDPTITWLDRVFSYSTPWTFTGSAGGGGGLFGIAGGAGFVDVKNSQRQRENGRIDFAVGGVSFGPEALEFSLSYSTPSMWSTGIGKIRARTSQPLTVEDMTGPLAILSFAFMPGQVTFNRGGTLTLYFLGLPYVSTIGSLWAGPIAWLSNAATLARAMGTMAGEGRGIDVGVSLLTGYGR